MGCDNYNSVSAVRDEVSALMSRNDLDQALKLIRDFVERIFTEPLCTSQVFGSKSLDELCQSIGRANFANIAHCNSVAPLDKPVYVYIVTKLQKSGGHTRVIEDFIGARPHARHIVLSTELAGKSDADYLMNGLASLVNVNFDSAGKHDNYQQRLTWLQERLLEIRPKRVYLFNHHQDSVAVAAVQPEMEFDISFYHHGDHHLCLGVYLPFVEHIDPHPMGFHECRYGLGVQNVYVPLTLNDKGSRPADWSFMEGGTLTTCTAARSNKVEIPYFVSYLDVVPELLKVTGGRHVHIGRLSPWALSRIRRGLKRFNVPADRFIYISWVPSVWEALHTHRIDLYVASFPYGGGLTLIEAMGAGIPVAMHQHIFSRVLSGIDLAYPEAFSWQTPSELLEFCAKATSEELRQYAQFARARYETYHRQTILADILASEGKGKISAPELSDQFQKRPDEFAAWVESQVSFNHLFQRIAYRLIRKVRNKLFI